jgi:hypothetical protein
MRIISLRQDRRQRSRQCPVQRLRSCPSLLGTHDRLVDQPHDIEAMHDVSLRLRAARAPRHRRTMYVLRTDLR